MLFWKKKPSARYVTTTLPYVNAEPHIGFAAEIVMADTIARYWRLSDYEVFFNTGTDEHGQKIAQKADESGTDRQQYVDQYAATFANLKDVLGLSNDNFIRTTAEDHKHAAQELWRRCEANGDIYKRKYKGLYCVGDEMFMKESDLVDGKCPNHPNVPLQEIEEENYFFKLSNYQSYLETYLSAKDAVVPEWRRQEALNFVKAGLEDFSISREKERLNWGVPVPGDDSQVMYVWFDALTNYISTLGWPDDAEGTFKKFWKDGETLQIAGKDQVRFQSIMWQAMLKSAGVPATDTVAYRGFITIDGAKMSKSLGNVITPAELVTRYGTEATRFLLLRSVHPFEDTDITWASLDEWYTANLVNGLGNFTARVMKMAQTYLDTPVSIPDVHFARCFNKLKAEYNLKDFRIDQEADAIVVLKVKKLDEYITQTEPFKLVKTNKDDAERIIKELVVELHEIAILLQPFMPETASTIIEAVKTNKKPENLFARLEQ